MRLILFVGIVFSYLFSAISIASDLSLKGNEYCYKPSKFQKLNIFDRRELSKVDCNTRIIQAIDSEDKKAFKQISSSLNSNILNIIVFDYLIARNYGAYVDRYRSSHTHDDFTEIKLSPKKINQKIKFMKENLENPDQIFNYKNISKLISDHNLEQVKVYDLFRSVDSKQGVNNVAEMMSLSPSSSKERVNQILKSKQTSALVKTGLCGSFFLIGNAIHLENCFSIIMKSFEEYGSYYPLPPQETAFYELNSSSEYTYLNIHFLMRSLVQSGHVDFIDWVLKASSDNLTGAQREALVSFIAFSLDTKKSHFVKNLNNKIKKIETEVEWSPIYESALDAAKLKADTKDGYNELNQSIMDVFEHMDRMNSNIGCNLMMRGPLVHSTQTKASPKTLRYMINKFKISPNCESTVPSGSVSISGVSPLELGFLNWGVSNFSKVYSNSVSVREIYGNYIIELSRLGANINSSYNDSILFSADEIMYGGYSYDDGNLRYAASGDKYWDGDLYFTPLLIDLGANPNVQNSEGLTPLMEAILEGHYDKVKYLIALSYLSIKNLKGQTAVEMAKIWDEKIGPKMKSHYYAKSMLELFSLSNEENCISIQPDLTINLNTTFGEWIKFHGDK